MIPPTDRDRHLVAVWNPSYATDALDEHIRILIDWTQRFRSGDCEEGDVYVWWGKVRSPNRDGALPHAADIAAIDEQTKQQRETHLYLTDYRSLYVALIAEITADDVMREEPDEAEHMPSYYAGHRFDFFFRLFDIRRLVSDDTPAVIDELRKLANVRYHDRPVSIYGGMSELPLIVTRGDEASWFDERADLFTGTLWAEHDANMRGETERTARDLRENLLGDVIWATLEATTRTFMASGEAIFRTHRDDPTFDFGLAAVEYAKAVESEINVLLFPTVRAVASALPPAERVANIEGRTIDLSQRVPHQSLSAVAHLLAHNDAVGRLVKQAFPSDWRFLAGELPDHVAPVIEARNLGAHGGRVPREKAARLREDILGIGCEGVIVRLARARLRARI